jgi:tetratricopeptide (TPR) repeat protein
VVRDFGSEHDLSVLLQWRGQARIDLGDVPHGFEDLREGLRIALEVSPAESVASAHVNLGDSVWFVEGPAKGQELYEAGAELADRRGSPGAADWARMQSMWTRYDLGAWDDVLEIGARVLANYPEREGSQIAVLAEIYRRDVMVHRGLPDAGDVVETALLPRAREIGDGQVVVPVFRVAALGRLARGNVADALALVEEADEILRNFVGFRSWFLDWAARVCRAAGAPDLLRSLIGQGIDHMTRDANSLTSAATVLAEIEGDDEAAFEGYRGAADRWEAFPSVLEQGLALAGAGRCLLSLGRPNEAVARLREARDQFASLAASPLVADVDALLARVTAKTS